jgi:hypothetical protein
MNDVCYAHAYRYNKKEINTRVGEWSWPVFVGPIKKIADDKLIFSYVLEPKRGAI